MRSGKGDIVQIHRERVRQLEAEIERLKAAMWCDVCLGKGDPGTGKPCICGGSGQAQDALVALRELLVERNFREEMTPFCPACAKVRRESARGLVRLGW